MLHAAVSSVVNAKRSYCVFTGTKSKQKYTGMSHAFPIPQFVLSINNLPHTVIRTFDHSVLKQQLHRNTCSSESPIHRVRSPVLTNAPLAPQDNIAMNILRIQSVHLVGKLWKTVFSYSLVSALSTVMLSTTPSGQMLLSVEAWGPPGLLFLREKSASYIMALNKSNVRQ